MQLMCNPFGKSQKRYFLNSEPKPITDNKNFWKIVIPLFSDKITFKEIINLTETVEILSSNIDIADTFNDFFSNVVQNLNITWKNSILSTNLCINPVLAVAEKYKHRQSIISINKEMREKSQPKFNFHFVTLEETLKEVALFSNKKLLKLQIFLLK